MKQILFFFTISGILFASPSFARGHGGGGHGGGGHAHSSHATGNRPYTSNSNIGHSKPAGAKPKKASLAITRSTSPAAIAAHHGRTLSGKPISSGGKVLGPAATTSGAITSKNGGVATQAVAGSGYNSSATTPRYYENYGNGYYGGGYANGYYYTPLMYDPYYSPFMFYYGYMWSPNYYPVNSPNYANSGSDDMATKEPMDGYVVFYGDTLSGTVTVAKKAISMETTDSGKDYDYRFHEKDPGLSSVTVYNQDDKQLNLVRLKDDTKNLWRIIHSGKLSIYDRRRGFLYKPEDVDLKTLAVYYNGELQSIKSSSVEKTKEWLTNFVNQAYGASIDPKKYSWRELLIYIDKLD